MCTPPWRVLKAFLPARTCVRMAASFLWVQRPFSYTPTHCFPGLCCSPSAVPATSQPPSTSTHAPSSLLVDLGNELNWHFCDRLFIYLPTLCFRHLAKLPRLLESEDVNMRIAAGETIALLFELVRDVDPVSFGLYLVVQVDVVIEWQEWFFDRNVMFIRPAKFMVWSWYHKSRLFLSWRGGWRWVWGRMFWGS